MKTCNACTVELSLNHFSKNQGVCKSCRAKKSKLDYEKRKKYLNKQKMLKSAEDIPTVPKIKCPGCEEYVLPDNFTNQVCNASVANHVCNRCLKIQQNLLQISAKEDTDTYVYLITCPIFLEKKRFKIGMHTGDITKLKNRYHTAFPDLLVERFWKIKNARHHEHVLHKKCKIFRIANSEWFESHTIPNLFDDYVHQVKEHMLENLSPRFQLYLQLSNNIQEAIHQENYNQLQNAIIELMGECGSDPQAVSAEFSHNLGSNSDFSDSSSNETDYSDSNSFTDSLM